ncbi:hypothetical protein HDU93_010088 [Gonapodya sp. JEL0774]|nr:hypothetical protein HDU93_010088 [Gonapodya sp. JEL0774]
MVLLIWFSVSSAAYAFGYITHSQFEAGITVADIFAKLVLTLILTNASIEQVHTVQVETVENVNTALHELVEELDAEIAETDAILARLIPDEVIQQLKNGEATDAREFPSVTVFFSDIASFTVLSGRTEPKEMIKMLERLWQHYDAIARKWGIYKIETIGDAFFGVAGCPTETPDHAERAVQFSIDIMAMIKDFRTEAGEPINIRIGLNTGPVTAGILGETNPHYTVVGDTATVASRMEASSKPGRIHINETTYNMVKDLGKFKLSGPDPVEIKGVTSMTYWVDGRL